jgi:uncharacterized protein
MHFIIRQIRCFLIPLANNSFYSRMKIVGRKAELIKFTQIVQSPKAEFVAVYGRRRVGKTFLIKEYFNHQFTFYATGLQKGNTQKQLTSFTIFINQSFNTEYEIFVDWLEAFRILIKELKKKKGKKIIFIDELPWLDTKKSDFLTGLDFFWNSWASTQPNLKLFVCGSAASWIINKLIKNKGGLHNRLTSRIKLEPFNLHETELFLRSKNIVLDHYQIVQLYMAFGGIPYYLEHVEKGLSASQIIDQLCFKKLGLLRTEFTYVFSSLFINAQKHEQIIRTIYSLGGTATREAIITKGKFNSGGDVSTKLNELEESGFISANTQYSMKSARKTYCISDFYTLFYLKFIEHTSKKLKSNWLNNIDDPAIKTWAGFTFEQVCMQHTLQIKEALKISGISSNITTWQKKGTTRTKGAQIDLVIDRQDRIINLCEIKFYTSKFTITKAYDLALRNKIAVFKENTKTNKAVFCTMITTYGLTQNEYSKSIIQNEIVMDDLFAAL